MDASLGERGPCMCVFGWPLGPDLPTPGYGCMPGYAACCRAASPLGRPWAGIDRWSASEKESSFQGDLPGTLQVAMGLLRPGYVCGMPFVYTAASVPPGCPFGVWAAMLKVGMVGDGNEGMVPLTGCPEPFRA